MHSVYILFDRSGVPFWVGASGNPDRRHQELRRQFPDRFYAAVVVASALERAAALDLESAFILAIGRVPDGPLLNNASYGLVKGRRLSLAHRTRISKTKLGKVWLRETLDATIKSTKFCTDPMKKECRRCGQRKPVTAFGKRGDGTKQTHPWCKKCRADYNAMIYRSARQAREPAK